MKLSFKEFNFISSEDGKEIPIPEKPEIDENSQRDIVNYKDRVFEIPVEMIFYLANLPENLNARIERTKRNGMGFMYPDGGYGCHYCSYYSLSPIKEAMNSPEEAIVHNTEGRPGNGVKGCRYKGTDDVRWATRFKHKDTRIKVMAQKIPCVVNDSMITELADRGLLDEFLVKDKEFDFPTLAELVENPELQKQYELHPIKRNPFEKLYEAMKKLF